MQNCLQWFTLGHLERLAIFLQINNSETGLEFDFWDTICWQFFLCNLQLSITRVWKGNGRFIKCFEFFFNLLWFSKVQLGFCGSLWIFLAVFPHWRISSSPSRGCGKGMANLYSCGGWAVIYTPLSSLISQVIYSGIVGKNIWAWFWFHDQNPGLLRWFLMWTALQNPSLCNIL